jgi:hypothetical protein
MASVGEFPSFFCKRGRVKGRFDYKKEFGIVTDGLEDPLQWPCGHDEPQMAQDQDAEEGLAASSNNGNDKSSVDVIDASQTIPETSTDLKATYNRVLITL